MGSSLRSYAATPFAALMMTYGTRSPRTGALPGSRLRMRSASSTCACFASYASRFRVSAFV